MGSKTMKWIMITGFFLCAVNANAGHCKLAQGKLTNYSKKEVAIQPKTGKIQKYKTAKLSRLTARTLAKVKLGTHIDFCIPGSGKGKKIASHTAGR